MDVIFQCVTWEAGDQMVETDGRERLKFVIHAFGRTSDGKSVHVRVLNFRPFMYLKIQYVPDELDGIAEFFSERYEDTVEVSVVKARSVWGFDNGAQHPFLKVSFTRAYACTRLNMTFTELANDLECPKCVRQSIRYESNLEPLLRFIHQRNLPSGGWIHVPSGCYSESDSNCDIGIECNWTHVSRASDDMQRCRAPLRILAFDIECHSRTGRFPVAGHDTFERCEAYMKNPKGTDIVDGLKLKNVQAVRQEVAEVMHAKGSRAVKVNRLASILARHDVEDGDPIVQIGMTVHNYGDIAVSTRTILTVGSCSSLPRDSGIVLYRKQSERELLLHFARLVGELDVDFVTGYNIFGFDWKYIVLRAMKLGIFDQFVSAELGMSRDLSQPCTFVRKTLASSALGDNMLYYVEMPGRTAFDMMKVVQRDHKLESYKLDHCGEVFLDERKHDVTPQEIFAAWNADGTHAFDERARVAQYCVQDCELCNRLVIRLDTIPNTLAMATVCFVPPRYIFTRGQGVKIFSLVLEQCGRDNMLFPTITMQKGDYLVLQGDAQYCELPVKDLAPNLPPEYDGATVLTPVPGLYSDNPVAVFDYASLYPSSMISENISHDTLVMDPKFDNLPGVQYNVVEYAEGGHVLTCKFAANQDGILPKILRQLLRARKETRARAKHSKATHRVSGEVRVGLKSDILQNENADDWIVEDAYDAFEKKVLDGMQLAFKVTANSLYGQMGAVTSPVYLKPLAACTTATGRNMIMKAKHFMEGEYGAHTVYGDSVAGHTPTILQVDGNVIVEKFENLAERFGRKWVPCVEDGRQTKESCELTGVKVWTDDGWTTVHRVIRHQLAPHKKMVRVVTHMGLVDVTDDHSLLRADKTHVSPANLAVGDHLLHHAFPTVPRLSDIHVGTYDCADQVSALKLSMYATSSGFSVSATDIADIYRVVISEYPNQNPAIKRMSEIAYDGFVYDFTTDNHHFAAGVGTLIVKNTDSVFLSFPDTKTGPDMTPTQAIQRCMDKSVQASSEFRQLLKPPHNLEFEKIYFPFAIFSKKRYVGHKYQSDLTKFTQDSMGIVLKRRDNAPIVKKIFQGALDKILNPDPLGVDDAVDFVKSCVRDMLATKYEISDFTITKTLRMHYKTPQSIAHKVLADRVAQRDPGNAFQSNDRVPFVYVCANKNAKSGKTLQGNRIETPEFVIANGKQIDYEHYITNQISKPVCQLFSLVAEALQKHSKIQQDFEDPSLDRKLRECKTDADREKVRQAAYDAMLAKKEKFAHEVLFAGLLREHRLKKEKQRAITGYLTRS